MLTQERLEYITVEEAAARAHTSASTVRRALKDGTLAYRAQQGKAKFLRADEVDAWAKTRSELRPIDGEH